MRDEDEVRDLLAEVGRTTSPDEPLPDELLPDDALPDDVARRLDDALAALVAERVAAGGRTTGSGSADTARGDVVRLSRRRAWLVSAGIAAAVVLATVVLPQLAAVRDPDVGVTAGDAASESVTRPEVHLSGPLVDTPSSPVPSPLPSQAPVVDAPVLRTATLADDVVALLSGMRELQPETPPTRTSAPFAGSGDASYELSTPQATRDTHSLRSTDRCTWTGRGTAYAVTIDERRGLAVVRDASGPEQVVRLFVCRAADAPLRVATAVVPTGAVGDD